MEQQPMCVSIMHELQGLSPVHLAVQNNADESVEVLLTHGADLNIQDHRVGASSIPCCCAETGSSTCKQGQTFRRDAWLVMCLSFLLSSMQLRVEVVWLGVSSQHECL